MQDDSNVALTTRVNALADQLRQRFEYFRYENAHNVSLFTRLTSHLGVIALVLIGLLLSSIQIQAAVAPRSYDAPTFEETLPEIVVDPSGQQTDLTLSAVPFTIQPKKEGRFLTSFAPGGRFWPSLPGRPARSSKARGGACTR